jgi:hypothetical protein
MIFTKRRARAAYSVVYKNDITFNVPIVSLHCLLHISMMIETERTSNKLKKPVIKLIRIFCHYYSVLCFKTVSDILGERWVCTGSPGDRLFTESSHIVGDVR